MTQTPTDSPISRVEPVDLEVEMQRSYLDYAMSVIVGRALPPRALRDVRRWLST